MSRAAPTRAPLPVHANGASPRTVYVTNMSDHAVAIRGALRNHGIGCVVLPPPDAETIAIGLDLCRGRECLPCFLATGDIVRVCRTGTIDPARSAFLMPAGPGPCRFGQYRVLQRIILDREGFGDIEILSPTSENSYRGFGDRPNALRLLAWEGIVAVDLLLKLRYEFRPYEREPGVTDAAFQRGLARIEASIAAGGGKPVMRALDEIAADFASLDVDRSLPRPIVAMLGEIYVMLNAYSNQDLIRKLEASGAEVVTGTLTELLHFSDETQLDRDRLFGSWLGFLGTKAVSVFRQRTERRMFARIAHLLRQQPDTPMRRLFGLASPYFDPLLGTEALITVAKVVDYAHHGVSGIVNVMPFSCMPGMVVSGLSARMRGDLGQLPWLDVNFDGQPITNIQTRLEAFVHQVTQHARSRAAGDTRGAHPVPGYR